MSKQGAQAKIHEFIKSVVELKKGELTEQSRDVFTIKYPEEEAPTQYTYDSALARKKNFILATPGSPMFQQMLTEFLGKGALSQISVTPKQGIEALAKEYFKDNSLTCKGCRKAEYEQDRTVVCGKVQPCFQRVNVGKIVSVTITKKEPAKYFQFNYLISFYNKLRPKNEEIIQILADEDGNIQKIGNFDEALLNSENLEVQDVNVKLKMPQFEEARAVIQEKLDVILQEKWVLFDLPLSKEKKDRLRRFEKRLKIERIEKQMSQKTDFDSQRWQLNYEALLSREQESLATTVNVKLISLLVINTSKTTFKVNFDNNAAIQVTFILGVNHSVEVTCPICHKSFFEGYATKDSLYVCKDCIKQSVDSKKVYSKKAALKLDETLQEYIEQDGGFVCGVCGKKHSRLLEFKCSHDNSSVCIYHYGLCDICGKVFSNLNLTATNEFRRKLCPKHVVKCENCQSYVGIDECKTSQTGKRLCASCSSKIKER